MSQFCTLFELIVTIASVYKYILVIPQLPLQVLQAYQIAQVTFILSRETTIEQYLTIFAAVQFALFSTIVTTCFLRLDIFQDPEMNANEMRTLKK